jgi:hypothetical protein
MNSSAAIFSPFFYLLLAIVASTAIASNNILDKSTSCDTNFTQPQRDLIEVGGQHFHPIKHTLQGLESNLIAKGSSHLTYFAVAICSAVLYLEPHAPNHAVQSVHQPIADAVNVDDGDTPQPLSTSSSIALEISYHKAVRASDFRWATTTYTSKNGHTQPHIVELINTFNSLYQNVKRGDRYLLEYQNEMGISLNLNGEHLGSVGKGSEYEKELAQAIYSIWFGEKPFFERLKKDLLTPIDV